MWLNQQVKPYAGKMLIRFSPDKKKSLKQEVRLLQRNNMWTGKKRHWSLMAKYKNFQDIFFFFFIKLDNRVFRFLKTIQNTSYQPYQHFRHQNNELVNGFTDRLKSYMVYLMAMGHAPLHWSQVSTYLFYRFEKFPTSYCFPFLSIFRLK